MSDSVILVGCGKMGGALLGGWLDRGVDAKAVAVVDPAMSDQSGVPSDVAVVAAPDALPAGLKPDVVVFAVKPQVMADIVPAYGRFVGSHTVFLSIAAGQTIGFLESHLESQPGTAAVVRSMPNTPAAVGRGITVACANARATDGQRESCQSLLEAVGEVAWVADEALLDPVTAVSGSGPAYVFLLIECLAEAGVGAGLPADLAQRLARATVAGSGELARQSDLPASELRRNVTSPGGTTAAALEVLMADDGLQRLMTRAVADATRRSRELAG